MAEAQALTLAFLADHPAEAARVVETLAVSDAAALFAEIPARVGAHVLTAMLTRKGHTHALKRTRGSSARSIHHQRTIRTA